MTSPNWIQWKEISRWLIWHHHCSCLLVSTQCYDIQAQINVNSYCFVHQLIWTRFCFMPMCSQISCIKYVPNFKTIIWMFDQLGPCCTFLIECTETHSNRANLKQQQWVSWVVLCASNSFIPGFMKLSKSFKGHVFERVKFPAAFIVSTGTKFSDWSIIKWVNAEPSGKLGPSCARPSSISHLLNGQGLYFIPPTAF